MRKKFPKFYGLRIYLSSTILYYFLVLPFLLILTIKYAPQLNEMGRNKNELLPDMSNGSDTISQRLVMPDDSLLLFPPLPADTVHPQTDDTVEGSGARLEISNRGVVFTLDENGDADSRNRIGQAFSLLFNLLLISFLLGFIFNFPFKRYFYRKRHKKRISDKLHGFCKKYLLLTPWINSVILFIAFAIAHGYMVYVMLSSGYFENELERSLYIQFFYVSLISSVLSVLFVYFWEKHRVHIRYIDHIYEEEELKKRIFGIKPGRIRNRLLISSAMTTLLPLTIVILYIFLSITYISDIEGLTFNEDQRRILFGDYIRFGNVFGDDGSEIPSWLFYFNAVNSFFMIIGIYSGIFVAFLYIVFFVKWTTEDIVRPVKELLQNMKITGGEEISNFSIVRTNDEIGELTEGYNEMTYRLKNYFENIRQMTEAYSRFVPRQFLEYLGKESFTDIKLGDQVQKEMTVLFTDIRSFTEISEQMTPKENFDFINYYLGYMEPVIRNNKGFIDKYIGDSIMALFPDSPEDGINAAIEMRIKLSQFNQVMSQFEKPAINSGIGLHTGKLMLGVVGGEGRMDGTVISDAVNLASRLEGLTKVYGSSIIISQDTLIHLKNPSVYHYRFLDITKVKGKKQSVYIFEILDGEPDDIKQLKINTKDKFTEGINLYKAAKFEEAMDVFEEVFEINKNDKAARLYIDRCASFLRFGVPDDWDGIDVPKR